MWELIGMFLSQTPIMYIVYIMIKLDKEAKSPESIAGLARMRRKAKSYKAPTCMSLDINEDEIPF